MSNKQRSAVKKTLKSAFTKAECNEIDKLIYERCELYIKNNCVETVEELYAAIAYERLGELLTSPENKMDILSDMKKDETLGWNSYAFQQYRDIEKQATQDKITGMKITKGDFKCRIKTCRSDECLYYSMQTSSCDEGTTVYVVCSKCGERFTVN